MQLAHVHDEGVVRGEDGQARVVPRERAFTRLVVPKAARCERVRTCSSHSARLGHRRIAHQCCPTCLDAALRRDREIDRVSAATGELDGAAAGVRVASRNRGHVAVSGSQDACSSIRQSPAGTTYSSPAGMIVRQIDRFATCAVLD